ncbi:urea ABC transporter ATP-binding protein UrtD [Kushneria aurantia]|uniref:Urea ABC transporter ATP-binding protein UrtD n=1 Tax=Kushneria aurantia TaxID=504092 RepID=A0ABV6G041_9GAMM|nr:urea ABC transporter ATP-binding protein UrtD [Kushneria aurantia]
MNNAMLLEIEDLEVSFDGFKAIDGLNFYVERHELRVVIGPNGAGKTTLLDLICGKTRATGGRITFNNRELTRLAEHRIVQAGVGRKFQTPSVYENLTVYQNLELSSPGARSVLSSLFFRRTPELRSRIDEIARTIYLSDQLTISAGLLSHGQKQWLEIGMLLIQDPQLLMLDEPVAGMSVPEREATAALLNRIRENRAVIVIEHDMDFVKEIGRKVTVLHQGRIIAEGPVEKVAADERVIEVYLGH